MPFRYRFGHSATRKYEERGVGVDCTSLTASLASLAVVLELCRFVSLHDTPETSPLIF